MVNKFKHRFYIKVLFTCICISKAKNADAGKYKYSGYGTGFDSRSESLFTDGSMGKYVTIFGTDMSS